jgi:hypothetical protein
MGNRQLQNPQRSREESKDGAANDCKIINEQKNVNMKRRKSFDEFEADNGRGVTAKKMDKNKEKNRSGNNRREKAMEKLAEKDYEASEEDEGSFNESTLRSSVTAHYSEGDIDFVDEERRAEKHRSRQIPSRKVPKVLFNWSEDDDDGREEKSSRALCKKVKPLKPEGKKHKNVKSRRVM